MEKKRSNDYWPVLDRELEIRGGGRSSRPLDNGGGGLQKKFFVWSKNKWGAGTPVPPGLPLDPSLLAYCIEGRQGGG